MNRELLEKKLKNNVWIAGAGAWQTCWETSRKAIGFDQSKQALTVPSQSQLREKIHPELLKRFASEISFIEPMTREDYIEAAKKIVERLDASMADKFLSEFSKCLNEAVENDLGMRYFENIMLSCLREKHLNLTTFKDMEK